MNRKLRREFVEDVRKRLEEEKDWPEVIETDRLEAAFEDLRRAGIFASVGRCDRPSDYWVLVRELADRERERGLEYWGTVFADEQTVEWALEGEDSSRQLFFGELTDAEESDPEQDAKVGRAVLDALRKHGFEPGGNGLAHSIEARQDCLTAMLPRGEQRFASIRRGDAAPWTSHAQGDCVPVTMALP